MARGDIDSFPERAGRATRAGRGFSDALADISEQGRVTSKSLQGILQALPMMTSPLGAVAGGVGAVVAQFSKWSEAQARSAREMADARANVGDLSDAFDAYHSALIAGSTEAEAQLKKEKAAIEGLFDQRKKLLELDLAKEEAREKQALDHLNEALKRTRMFREDNTQSLQYWSEEHSRAQGAADQLRGEIDAIAHEFGEEAKNVNAATKALQEQSEVLDYVTQGWREAAAILELYGGHADKTRAASRQMVADRLREEAVTDDLDRALLRLRNQREAEEKVLLNVGTSDAEAAARAEEIRRIDELIAALGRLKDSRQQTTKDALRAMEEEQRSYEQTADTIGSTMGAAIVDLASGQRTLEGVMRDSLEQIVQHFTQAAIKHITLEALEANATVGAEAAEGGARAMAAHADIPFVGLAIGAAAAAAIVAFIMGQKRFIKAAGGGELTGGIPGVDSIPLLGMSEENMLDRSTNLRLKRMLDAFENGGIGQSVVIHATAHQENLVPESDAVFARRARAIVTLVQDAINHGEIRVRGR